MFIKNRLYPSKDVKNPVFNRNQKTVPRVSIDLFRTPAPKPLEKSKISPSPIMRSIHVVEDTPKSTTVFFLSKGKKIDQAAKKPLSNSSSKNSISSSSTDTPQPEELKKIIHLQPVQQDDDYVAAMKQLPIEYENCADRCEKQAKWLSVFTHYNNLANNESNVSKRREYLSHFCQMQQKISTIDTIDRFVKISDKTKTREPPIIPYKVEHMCTLKKRCPDLYSRTKHSQLKRKF